MRSISHRLSDRATIIRRLVGGLAFAVLVAGVGGCNWSSNKGPSTSGRNPDLHLLVRGYLAVAVGQSPDAEKAGLYSRSLPAKNLYLPGVEVFLRDSQSNADGTSVKTDLSGRFSLLASKKGSYRLCWKSPVFGDGCASNVIKAGVEPVFVSTLHMSIPRKDGFTASMGKVRFADGALPRTMEPYGDINSYAMVSLRDSNKVVLAEVPVNNFGDYLLPYIPQKETVAISARIENGEGTQVIDPQAFVQNPRLVQFHLTIDNSKPRLDAIVPLSVATGKRVQVATPGDKIALKTQARDRDGDSIKVQWSIASGHGVLSATTGDQVEWTLPTQAGSYAVLAIAADGKGGYDRYNIRLSVGAPGVAFSGTVAATDGTLLNGAEVEINGKKQTTDNQGRFLNYVPEQERYVFNIRKAGYGFYSKIYDRSVAGARWTLVAATVSTFDPTKEIAFQDKRSARNCVGPASARINWDEGPALKQVWWQDGKGNNVPPPIASDNRKDLEALMPWRKKPSQDGCGPGIAVKIPANGLQTEGGAAPVGNVSLSLATIDLDTPEQMPGDDGVERAGSSSTGWMQSYGAGVVELQDSTGARLQLKPNVQAELTIPVDRSQLLAGGALPATAPRLYYDEVKGIWLEDGKLTLDAAKLNYVTKVKHFSAQNTDLVFTNPSCIRVQSTITPPYDLEITVPLPNGAAPKQKVLHVTDAPPHVIYHLPNNVPVTLVAIAPGVGSTPPRSLGVFVVNSGPPQAGGFGSPPPASACATEVQLNAQTFPAGGEFLHGLDSFAATALTELDIGVLGTLSDNLDKATQNYYTQIDPVTDAVNRPNGDRTTLDDFKLKNGFTAPSGFNLCSGVPCADPDTEINTAYANSGDLGFGRDMHCRRHGAAPNYNYACYVTNYGFGGIANPANGVLANTDDALDANNASTNTGVVATVAMEYAPIENDAVGDRVVKFFVYNAAGNRVNNADLDGHGRRPVPQLCMVCHGGAYAVANTGVPGFTNATSVKLGSRFLPFDMHLFTYPTAPDKAAQQNAFKHLNEDIVRNAPALGGSDAIGDIVTAMYQGSATQKEEMVVPAWQQTAQPKTAVQENFYKRVVGNACRTCHAAQVFATLQFASAENFIRDGYLGTAETRVCTEHVMPHASRTHDIFWGQSWENSFGAFNPTLIGQFQAFGDAMKILPAPAGWSGTWVTPQWNGQKCGFYQGAGSTPASQYTDFVHPLWSRNYSTNGGNARCSGCHGELSGLPADTRNQLLTNNTFGSSGVVEVVAGNLSGSQLVTIVNGALPSGTPRMPYDCTNPGVNRRCLNKSGSYDVTTDTNPSSTTSEINRIEYWVTQGAQP